ncbi:MAG: septum formation inhibitor Maf [Gammaproteobacteria bacterium]|jgi:septum formation protein|nr:septum formation inhibitor Maf [Gammaproteobacteria bacterium]
MTSEPTPALVCLASASPRRRDLLWQIGVAHKAVPANLDENPLPAESPHDYVERLAVEKAMTVRHRGERLPVLAADTAVVLDGVVFGKPVDRADALAMLGRLSGRVHQVLTAVALASERSVEVRVSATSVRLRDLTLAEREAYWQSGEPRDKAGGYAIQGYGAVFVESLSGSYSGVVGLPLAETAELLRAAGIAVWRGSRA